MRLNMPKLIRLSTERFVIRTLKPGDASERWIGWAADPEVMEPVNTKPAKMTLKELQNYIGSFDQSRRVLVGVFDKRNDLHIGFYAITRSEKQRTATFNVIIGDKDYWGEKVVLETRAALLDHFFDKEGVEKAIGMPLARNFPAVFNYKAQGWRLEGVLRGQCRSAKGGKRLDQCQFGLLREEWRQMRKAGRAT
ncbi:GNAT family N-acetyltransferase [Kaustia mangrovi]|uniref:GNAT family N-acetyltransferase n=1 Tax=Kaustia mangrovi TaxID=2593653 RepID=A0A7S8C309_9HYPH|nr:GNAT family protein [Kaustia mangrovi]QPC42444.1 GNAT family N-acetyltransferase [Kaustia mangrovi]